MFFKYFEIGAFYLRRDEGGCERECGMHACEVDYILCTYTANN